MSNPDNQIEFTSPADKFRDEVLPLSLLIFGKEVPDLNFQEAAGLVGIILAASQVGVETISYGERVVANVNQDGPEALGGVLGQVSKEFERIYNEGEEVIINVRAVRTPEYDTRRKPPIECTYRFPRLSNDHN